MDDSLAELVARQLRGKRVVLAVSGGRDSMTLMHAALTHARESVACVASFDHAHRRALARRALALVARRRERARRYRASPSAQRRPRTPRPSGARSAGASSVVSRASAARKSRPRTRATIRSRRCSCARCAAPARAGSRRSPRRVRRRSVCCVPCSRSAAPMSPATPRARVSHGWRIRRMSARDHLRNRIRHELLPALARARPSLSDELFALGARAATLRAEVERFVDHELALDRRDGAVSVARELMLRYDAPALALLWPAVAARAGVTLDRRGTERLVAFTTTGRSGARMQLSGGFEALSHRGSFVVRRSGSNTPQGALELSAGVQLGRFRFRCSGMKTSSRYGARSCRHERH